MDPDPLVQLIASVRLRPFDLSRSGGVDLDKEDVQGCHFLVQRIGVIGHRTSIPIGTAHEGDAPWDENQVAPHILAGTAEHPGPLDVPIGNVQFHQQDVRLADATIDGGPHDVGLLGHRVHERRGAPGKETREILCDVTRAILLLPDEVAQGIHPGGLHVAATEGLVGHEKETAIAQG